MLKKLKAGSSGEGYIDVVVLLLCAMLVIALAVKVLPVYVAKHNLDTYAAELVREAEITGQVGSATSTSAIFANGSMRNSSRALATCS